jgi:ABC-type transport system involved in cytochrome c biogenesis permease subunit
MRSLVRIVVAVAIGLVVGFVGATINGQSLVRSMVGAAMLAMVVGAIVALFSWATDVAQDKGYSAWLGVFAVLVLNVLGLLLLVLLPSRADRRTTQETGGSDGG